MINLEIRFNYFIERDRLEALDFIELFFVRN